MKLHMGTDRLRNIKEKESEQWYVLCICQVIYNKYLYARKRQNKGIREKHSMTQTFQ